jgi:hypothetical protein
MLSSQPPQVNLDQLAELAGRARDEAADSVYHTALTAFFTPSRALALVAAVKAAQDYFAQSLPYSDDADAAAANDRLRAALAPFKAGETT